VAGHAGILGDSEPQGKRVTRGGGLGRFWGGFGAVLGVYGRSAAGLYLRVAVILVLMREEVDPGRMLVIVFARLNGPDEGFSGLSFLFETLHTR
jgi:hypothetical protein